MELHCPMCHKLLSHVLVPSCFNKFGTSWPVNNLSPLVTSLKALSDLLQGWPHKVVTILLYHDCIGLVGNNIATTSLIISTRLLQVVNTQLVDNLGQAVRTQFVDGLVGRLATRCKIFTRCWSTRCWQIVTSLMALSDLLQDCSNKSDTAVMT